MLHFLACVLRRAAALFRNDLGFEAAFGDSAHHRLPSPGRRRRKPVACSRIGTP
jgi:hypothetical protein